MKFFKKLPSDIEENLDHKQSSKNRNGIFSLSKFSNKDQSITKSQSAIIKPLGDSQKSRFGIKNYAEVY